MGTLVIVSVLVAIIILAYFGLKKTTKNGAKNTSPSPNAKKDGIPQIKRDVEI